MTQLHLEEGEGAGSDHEVGLEPFNNESFDSSHTCSNDEGSGSGVDGNGAATPITTHGRFFKIFFGTDGAPQVLLLTLTLSLGIGSFVSVVPGIMGDRFARLEYGYDGPPCADFRSGEDRPDACRRGGDEAQSAAAGAAFVKNLLVLMLSSIVGSLSDCHGRKGFLAFGFMLLALTPLSLLMIQLIEPMSPIWFYASQASHGLTSCFTVCLTILSDVMPPSLRAPSFGLFIASYLLGFAFSQFFVKFLSHTAVTIVATAMLLSACLFSLLVLKETLPEEAKRKAIAKHAEDGSTWMKRILRPILELSILNRNTFFRLLAVVSVCSGMIYSSDTTLIVYYMKNQLNIGYQSISSMFFCTSLVGVLVQIFILKAMIGWFGEKYTLVVGMAIGALHNLLYGIAGSKLVVFVGLIISEFASMHFPVLVSIRSTNVGEDEQGHVQGAFFALAAIADAVGPVFLQSIYKRTKDITRFPGPGTMFVVASGVYLFGALLACALPAEKVNTRRMEESAPGDDDSLELESSQEPLVPHRSSDEN